MFKNYYWAVECYNIDKLKIDILIKLKINSHKLFQSNSDKFMYLQTITTLYDLKKLQIMNSEKLYCWFQQIIELDKSICAQMITIIHNDAFQDSFIKFAFTLYK